jgi:flagellar basal body-associated protein FliL
MQDHEWPPAEPPRQAPATLAHRRHRVYHGFVSKSERILAVIIVALSVALIAGTVWGLMTDAPGRKKARQAVPSAVSASGVYDGIGRVRAATADGAVVIIHVAFPYDSQDRQFREELSARRIDLKTSVKDFMSERVAADFHPSNENTVKAALRDTMNGMLVFGRIEELYFAEFEVIP